MIIEVDKFRGAIQGEYEQGMFFVTFDFTREARDASLRRAPSHHSSKRGRHRAADDRKGIGVRRTALFAYSDLLDELIDEE